MSESKITLGIIGGGQLAQMLVQNNPFHDLHIVILADQKNCPAATTGAEIIVGSPTDSKVLRSFFQKIQILTIESEFISVSLLGAMKDEFERVLFFPSITSLRVTQNKLLQKFLFEKLHLPSAQFLAFQPGMDQPTAWLKKSYEIFPKGFMLKKDFGGYDGKGNFKVQNIQDFANAEVFIHECTQNNISAYAEELIPFQKELAQIFVRSLDGSFIAYPLVITEQEENVCQQVYGPATSFEIPLEIEQQTTDIGRKIAEELNFIGTFAIEFFYEQENKILINEMAPRVHNSGHYTLDASPVNQFENHLRAVLGAPLKQPATYPFFAMRNILGSQQLKKNFENGIEKKFEQTEDAKVYWYFKAQTNPLRKLGHINTIAMTKEDLLKKIKLMEKIETHFWKNI